jgi:uncharacterized protein
MKPALGLLLLVAGCNRTPPEPAPAPSIAVEPRSTSALPLGGGTGWGREVARPNRCLAKLADSPPPVPPAASRCPPDPEPSQKLPRGEVSFPESPKAPKLEVELAVTPRDIERGLMYRTLMGDDRGMLFRLDGRRDHTFWMRNTCIPLDMMFVDDDGVIVGIVEGAAPLTESTRSVGCPSVYVLEVNGGFTRKFGVQPGQRITIPDAARQ